MNSWYACELISDEITSKFPGRKIVYIIKTTEGHCTMFGGSAFHGPWHGGMTSEYARKHYRILRKCSDTKNAELLKDFNWFISR